MKISRLLKRKLLPPPRWLLMALLAAGPAWGAPPVAQQRSADFVVTKTTDTQDGVCDADCSLREAIVAANARPGPDTIELPSGTYSLYLSGPEENQAEVGDLDITDILTLVGTGEPVIDGRREDRVLHIVKRFMPVTISGVTITRGWATAEGGGGILNAGRLLLLDSNVISNTAIGQQGGGILNIGTLTIVNSTVAGNRGGNGGGISNRGVLTLANSTISSNRASARGGGIRNNQFVYLNSVTITGNIADRNSNRTGNGGGIFSSSGTITFRNTLIAGNFDFSVQALRHPDCSARLRSQGYNLVGDNAGCVFNPANGDQFGTSTQPLDPLLDSLEDNGGPTLTHALLRRSPAIDAGNPFRCADRAGDTLTTDQRGAPRAVDGRGTGRAICDIGAYEFEARVPTPTPAATPTRTATPLRTPTRTPIVVP